MFNALQAIPGTAKLLPLSTMDSTQKAMLISVIVYLPCKVAGK